jgi:hypothetical protein
MSRLSPIPLVCYAILVTYACYATVTIGHWPYYAHPDPKELPFRPLMNVVVLTTFAGLLSVVGLPLLHSLHSLWQTWRKTERRPLSAGTLTFYLAGAVAWIADLTLTFADKRSLTSWIFD